MREKLETWQLEIYNQVRKSLDEHKQAGLKLFTAGGKSYIAKNVILDEIGKNSTCKILWISSKSAVENIKENHLSDPDIAGHMVYATFTALERYEEGSKWIRLNLEDKYQLIVIDEAHRVLAHYSYMGLRKLISKYSGAALLAMTATPKRYSDGRNALEELVPNGTIAGMTLEEGKKAELITRMQYRICSTQIVKEDYRAIGAYREISEKYGVYRSQIDTLEKYLSNFKDGIENNLTNLIRANIRYDGSTGDRYIAFFPTVDVLDNMAEQVYNSFKEVFPQCTIRILKYHSKLNNVENKRSFELMSSEPIPNTIDIMLTVEKGGESFHPNHMRGILMYRMTRSDRIYQQQLGRAVKLRKYSDGEHGVYIFDFANNVSIVGGDSLGIGYRALSDRPKSKYDRIDSVDDIADRVGKITENNADIDIKVGDPILREYLDMSKSMREFMPWLVMWDKVQTLLDKLHKYQSVYDALGEGGIAHKFYQSSEIQVIRKWFNMNQQKFMSGDFDEFETEKLAYFEMAGCHAYMTPKMNTGSIRRLYTLEKIAQKLDELGYDYSRLDEVEGLRKAINQLRTMYATEKLTSAEVIYCRRNGIDVAITGELSDMDIESLSHCREAGRLVRLYNKLLDKYNKIKADKKELSYEDFIELHAALIQFRHSFYHSLGIALVKRLETACTGDLSKYQVDPMDMENARAFEEILDKIRNGVSLTIFDEDTVFQGLDDFDKNFGPFTKKMLELNGVTPNNYMRRIGSNTPWMRLYNRVVNEHNVEAYVDMLKYNPSSLPDKIQKLKGDRRFKQVEVDLKSSAEDEIMRKLVKRLCNMDTAVANDIAARVARGYSKAKTFSFAFNQKVEKMAEVAIRGELLSMNEARVLKTSLTGRMSATKQVVLNLEKLPGLSECEEDVNTRKILAKYSDPT